MGAMQEHTVSNDVRFHGVWLHNGRDANVTIKPAPVNAGIVFERSDLVNGARKGRFIKVDPFLVSETRLGTTLRNDAGVAVSTVEHLLAALAIAGVCNAVVEIDNEELPILDGSAAPFVSAIVAAGRVEQKADQHPIGIDTPLKVTDGDRFIRIDPASSLSFDVTIDFGDCVIGKRNLVLPFDDLQNRQRLAMSRTFCRLGDVEQMRDAGLIRGGSLEN